MSEETLDLRHQPKDRAYAQLHAHLLNVLGGIDDDIAAMATMSALIHHAFRFPWTGFYRVASPRLLRIGRIRERVGLPRHRVWARRVRNGGSGTTHDHRGGRRKVSGAHQL